MNKGSNSGNFWRDSEVLEFYFVIKMPKVAGIGALVHKFHIGWWPTDAKTALDAGLVVGSGHTREKIISRDLPRVVYHQVYNVYEDEPVRGSCARSPRVGSCRSIADASPVPPPAYGFRLRCWGMGLLNLFS